MFEYHIGKRDAPPREMKLEELLKDRGQVRWLLRGSDIVTNWRHSKEKSWDWWEKGRRPIAGIIDRLADPQQKNVSVFDYGCANGLLLRSLQEWSGHEIDPYGFDKKAVRINAARWLFPHQKDHFAHEEKGLRTFPSEFDFVYWNLWDNWKLDTDEQREHLWTLLRRAKKGGYLIIGLYDHNRRDRAKKLQRLSELGFIPEGIEEGSSGNETFAWFKREA